MRLYLIGALIVLVALSNAQADVHGIHDAHDKCQAVPETHVHDDIIIKRLKNEPVQLPDNFPKHILCVLKGIHLINDDGQIIHESLKTHIGHIVSDETKIKTIVHECDVVKETPEKTAHELFNCLKKYNIIRENELDGHTDEHHHGEHAQHHHDHSHDDQHVHHH